MSDWKPGDKAVFVGHPGKRQHREDQSLVVGRTYTVSKALNLGGCHYCRKLTPGIQLEGRIYGSFPLAKGHCSNVFRRPINLQSLFNVAATVKPWAKKKEPA